MEYKKIFEQRRYFYHKAMEEYPHVRTYEFDTIIKLCNLSEGEKIADIPSGGCYLENYLKKKKINILSIETSRVFFNLCKNKNKILVNSFDELTLESNSLDKIISLAGVHHIANRKGVYKEWYRILKKNGALCLADVKIDTPVAKFLNEFVDKFNSMGHKGVFLTEEDLTFLEDIGFKIKFWGTIKYYWVFRDVNEVYSFLKFLFGLDKASEKDIYNAIEKYFGGFSFFEEYIGLPWELMFIKAIK